MMIRYESLKNSLEVLKKLNSVNESNGQVVPYYNFYIPEVMDKIDIRKDYVNWVHRGKILPSVSPIKKILRRTTCISSGFTAANELGSPEQNHTFIKSSKIYQEIPKFISIPFS
jgi:hypothetical protein